MSTSSLPPSVASISSSGAVVSDRGSQRGIFLARALLEHLEKRIHDRYTEVEDIRRAWLSDCVYETQQSFLQGVFHASCCTDPLTVGEQCDQYVANVAARQHPRDDKERVESFTIVSEARVGFTAGARAEWSARRQYGPPGAGEALS
jgi:hypothetical protein